MRRFAGSNHSPLPVLEWHKCVAKTYSDGRPGISVFDHGRIVGEVARALVEQLPTAVRDLCGNNPAAIAALHDVGKVSPGFQKRIWGQHLQKVIPELARAIGGFEENHAEVGEAALNAFLDARFETTPLAAIVGVHHGDRDKTAYLDDTAGKYGGPGWAKERRELIDELLEHFGPLADTIPQGGGSILAGLVCISDWIGSDEEFFPSTGLPSDLDLNRKAAEAITSCGWGVRPLRRGLSFQQVFGFQPHPLQQDFADAIEGPGLYIFEAPTGTGKTEAALYAAYKLMSSAHNYGLFFGLPTRLTSDKIHERVAPFINQILKSAAGVKLAHGTAWLRAFERGGEALNAGGSWFDPRKRTLLYPFAVGTIDQALLSVLRVKHFFVRSFGLAGKVVILDEVHSYDVYTSTLLERLIERLLETKCSVIVLSATLTSGRRNALLRSSRGSVSSNAYPLITREVDSEESIVLEVTAPGSRKFKTRLESWDDIGVAESAIEHAFRGHCTICIANTVDRAQRWYNLVKAKMPASSFPVGLLHSRFPVWRRQELEQEWINNLGKSGIRPHGCVLVATQVVEQSVDIDADWMLTELAPTDMLIQRMGRLWRHEREGRPSKMPELVVITGDIGSAGCKDELIEGLGRANCHVYHPYALWRTYQAWKNRQEILVPEDIRPLLEETYRGSSGDEDDFILLLLQNLKEKKNRLSRLAVSAEADVEGLTSMKDEEYVGTRYSDLPTLDVLLLRQVDQLGSQAELLLSDGTAVSVDSNVKNPWVTSCIYRNLVSIPRYRLQGVKTPFYLKKHFFRPTAVLIIAEDGRLLRDGNPTGMRYDNGRGITFSRKESPARHTLRTSTLGEDPDWEFVNESDW